MSALPPDWPHREASRLVRSGALEWHVQTMGRDNAPVALLIHGTGAATHSWRAVMPMLAETHRVVAIDLPGHGFTKGSFLGPSLPAVAKALAGLLATLDVRPAWVIGHSAGAAIALRMALDGLVSPQAVMALSPALLPFPGIAQQLFPAMAKLLFVNPFAPHIFAQIARGPGTVERFLLRSTGSAIDPAGIAQYARLFGNSTHCAGALALMANWDLTALKADLPGLAVPLLVLHGDHDAAIPVASAREAAALVPGACFEVLAGLGHLAHEEAPGTVLERINAFARQAV